MQNTVRWHTDQLDGAVIGSFWEHLVKQNDAKGFWLHSMNIVIYLNSSASFLSWA